MNLNIEVDVDVVSKAGEEDRNARLLQTTDKYGGRMLITEVPEFKGGTGFPKSNKKPHEHGELIAGDIKVFTYAELKTAVRNFKNPAHLGSQSKEKWWIDNTGYSPCMDDTGLPILVKIVDSHILSDLKKLKEFCHPNLVKVIGYCKGETNLLVSEFVHNGNFENLLRSGKRYK
ncbi:serine/threonine/dual specificity protein kinase, catalytic domain-containing protein [Tanacetum coccineum]